MTQKPEYPERRPYESNCWQTSCKIENLYEKNGSAHENRVVKNSKNFFIEHENEWNKHKEGDVEVIPYKPDNLKEVERKFEFDELKSKFGDVIETFLIGIEGVSPQIKKTYKSYISRLEDKKKPPIKIIILDSKSSSPSSSSFKIKTNNNISYILVATFKNGEYFVSSLLTCRTSKQYSFRNENTYLNSLLSEGHFGSLYCNYDTIIDEKGEIIESPEFKFDMFEMKNKDLIEKIHLNKTVDSVVELLKEMENIKTEKEKENIQKNNYSNGYPSPARSEKSNFDEENSINYCDGYPSPSNSESNEDSMNVDNESSMDIDQDDSVIKIDQYPVPKKFWEEFCKTSMGLPDISSLNDGNIV